MDECPEEGFMVPREIEMEMVFGTAKIQLKKPNGQKGVASDVPKIKGYLRGPRLSKEDGSKVISGKNRPKSDALIVSGLGVNSNKVEDRGSGWNFLKIAGPLQRLELEDARDEFSELEDLRRRAKMRMEEGWGQSENYQT